MSTSGDIREGVSISALGQRISSLSSQISSYLTTSSLPSPTFEADSGDVPDTLEYESLRASLNNAALDLLRLVNGPRKTLQELLFSHSDLAAFQIALDRRLFDHVPLPSTPAGAAISEKASASISQIAQKSGMDEDRTGRVLRMLATHRVFEEVEGESGNFKHTAGSALLARDEGLHALADMQMDDVFRASSEASAAISRSPAAATHSPFQERYGCTIYEYYEKKPDNARRFAKAMSGWSASNQEVDELYSSFPWASLKDGKVVDIGGGSGHVSIGLAHRFPSLHFVVQDISHHILSQAQQDVNERVTFQQYDFFEPQPVHDASVFLLRQCLHNHNDGDVVKIIRAVVPALERCGRETPLLINEMILPDNGTATRFEEHKMRQVDFLMMVELNTKERSEGDFTKLIKEADERLEITGVSKNTFGFGLIEVRLDVK